LLKLSGRFLLLFLPVLLSGVGFPQGGDQMSYASVSNTRFAPLAVLPPCMTISAVHGDPTKGAATILAKTTTGCVIPWHWHSVNEQLIFVAGTATAQTKAGPGHGLKGGDFIFLPAKQVHQFTCTATCIFYDVLDGPFDIHYVDKDGNEIPTAQLLKKLPKPVPPKK
jgi:quercetin dioxygenase-like cupin family protein